MRYVPWRSLAGVSVFACGLSLVLVAAARGAERPGPADGPALVGADDAPQLPGWLGVYIHDAAAGVEVIGVIPGSPAAAGGVRAGDVIHFVNDQLMHSTGGLIREIRGQRPGTPVALSIWRDRQVLTLRADLLAMPTASGGAMTNRIGIATPTTSEPAAVPGGGTFDGARRANSLAAAAGEDPIRALQREVIVLQRQLAALKAQREAEMAAQEMQQEEMQDPYWGWDPTADQGHDPALFQ